MDLLVPKRLAHQQAKPVDLIVTVTRQALRRQMRRTAFMNITEQYRGELRGNRRKIADRTMKRLWRERNQ